MAEREVDINIKTTSDNSGVKASKEELDGLTQSTKKSSAESTRVAKDAAKERAKADKDAARAAVQAERERAREEKQLWEEAKRRHTEKLTKGKELASQTAASAKMSAGTSFKITNTANQIQDLAVQIQGGTSAARAFSQQAPQLLSGLGAWGAVAGVAAIGIGFLAEKWEKYVEKVKTGTNDIKESIKTIGDAHSQAEEKAQEAHVKAGDRYQSMLQLMAAQKKAQEEIKTAARNANKEIQDSYDNVRIAAVNYLEKIGEIKNAEQQREQIAKEKRKREADNKIAELNAQIEAKRDDLKFIEVKIENAKQMVAKAAKEEEQTFQLLGSAKAHEMSLRNTSKNFKLNGQDELAEKWERKADFVNAKEVQPLEIRNKYKEKNTKEAEAAQIDVENELKLAKTDLDKVEKTLGSQIEQIQKTAEMADTVEEINKAGKDLDKTKETLQTIKSTLEATANETGSLSASGARSLEIITKVLKDGMIDPSETNEVVSAMQSFRSSQEAMSGAVTGSFKDNLILVTQLTAQMNSMRAQQKDLMNKIQEADRAATKTP